MIFKPLLTLILICTVAWPTFAQNSTAENVTLQGVVLDKETNTPLAYVSVGILNKPFGTVSDTVGHFIFNIGQENFTDTLQVSIVGYSALKISVKDFMSGSDKAIKLFVKVEQLAEVKITNSTQRANTEMIGREDVSKLVQISIHNKKTVDETIGSEMGMRYTTNRKKAIIKNFNFYISANNFNFIKFRVNVYSLKNDLPDTLMYNKQIFATVDNFKIGWNKVDLERYNIKVNGAFVVTVQWIESRMYKKENPITILPVSVTPFSKNCYVRIASQDKWKRMGVNLSSFVTLAY
ncbi:MAG TPA: carboxypeptidase-like regulatory domain-containing protein [Mucilaginibacter sp.]